MSAYLLDASVWLAARDADDPHHNAARRLVEGAEQGRRLTALDLTLYEVANVAVRSWQSPDRARIVADLVIGACTGGIAPVDEDVIDAAIAVADARGLSVYDASYVAVARRHGWTLVSADHKDLVEPGLAITPAAALAA